MQQYTFNRPINHYPKFFPRRSSTNDKCTAKYDSGCRNATTIHTKMRTHDKAMSVAKKNDITLARNINTILQNKYVMKPKKWFNAPCTVIHNTPCTVTAICTPHNTNQCGKVELLTHRARLPRKTCFSVCTQNMYTYNQRRTM